MTCSEGRFRPAALLLAAALLAAPLHAVKRRAFVTSVTGTGDLSSWPDAGGHTGLDAGDAICRARAAAAALPNAAAYRAWLSDAWDDAYCHVQGLTGTRANSCNGAAQPGAGPWYLSNGFTNFTSDLATLTGPQRVIYRPVTLDEFGGQVAPDADGVWTGTDASGAGSMYRCDDWSSANGGVWGVHGSALMTAEGWTYTGNWSCLLPQRLLCLEPGASETATLGWSPGALVFVTSVWGGGDLAGWPQAGGATGVAAGDAICRSLAAAAHLPSPDSFVAWLASGGAGGTGAIDRLTLGDQVPYRRLDAYTVGTRAEFLTGFSANSIHVDENGHYLTSADAVWTGTDEAGAAASPDCGDWLSSGGSDQGLIGNAASARSGLWTTGPYNRWCSAGSRLYCFSNVVTIFWDGFESGGTGRWSASVPQSAADARTPAGVPEPAGG